MQPAEIWSALRRHGMAVLVFACALLINGCQATLFAAVNATSGDRGLDEHTGLVFDASHRLALDVYAPHGAHDLPVVLFFYGGSWQDGKRQWYRWVGETLARHGLVAMVPDYRKYPQVRLDGFMTDAAHAVAWAHAHASDYGGNPRELFLMGHSAGAHIAALLATDAHWLASVGMHPRDLSGVVGLAGPYDFLPLTDPKFIDMFGRTHAVQEQSQPIHFVHGNEPPMLLLQGSDDDIVGPRNARSLANALRAKGETVTVHMYPGIGHIRLLLSLSRPLRGSAPALDDTLQFIRDMAAATVSH